MAQAAPEAGKTIEAKTAPAGARSMSGGSAKAAMALGGVATALVAAGMVAAIAMGPGLSGQSQLSMVAQDEIGAATTTLDPRAAGTLADEAKRCTVPLASAVISKGSSGAAGTIRIRSGSYLSPPFVLTDAPQRVAFPFPAAYTVGSGTITIEGAADNAVVSLTPTIAIPKLAGGRTVSVWWTPRKSC